MLAYTKYHFVPKFMVKNDTFAELLSFSACPSTTAHLISWSGWRMERRSAWEEKGGLLFRKQNEEANNLQELTLLLCLFHSSSFSRVNPLALAQFPLRTGPSDSISICLNYKIPTPYSLSLAITYTQNTLPTGVIHAAWGGHGRLWVGSINVMVHTHKRSRTHVQPHHRWGPPYLPSPTEGHPAANEDTQTPLMISTTLA